MAITQRSSEGSYFIGTSSDTKPTTGVPVASLFFETNTGDTYVYSGAAWAKIGIVPASTNIIGKVGIDQTTPGTTNAIDPAAHAVACGEIAGAASATQMPTIACKMVRFKACISNTGNVYLGGASVTKPDGSTDVTTGLELLPGDDTGWLFTSNLNAFYRICDNATDDLTYLALA